MDHDPTGAGTALLEPERRFVPKPRPGGSDRAFSGVTLAAGLTVLGLLALVGVFLAYRAYPAIADRGWSFFTTSTWRLDVRPRVFGVLGLLYGTIVVALIAMVVAVPVSCSPPCSSADWRAGGCAGCMIGLVDLLAAIPSLLYGLWGFVFLQPQGRSRCRPGSTTTPAGSRSSDTHRRDFGSSYFIAGLVVSLMVLPITTSVVARGVQPGAGRREGGGARARRTRWGMVRTVVLPFGRGGHHRRHRCSAWAGRWARPSRSPCCCPRCPSSSAHVLQSGGGTISGFIASKFGAGRVGTSGAAGRRSGAVRC